MTINSASPNTAWQKTWIAIRFVLFGIGGFWLLMLSFVEFMERVFRHDKDTFHPLLSLPLMVIAGASVLFGADEWRRWAYLGVFLSMPLSLYLLSFLPISNFSFAGDKLVGSLIPALAGIGTYAIVRRYYRRRDVRREDMSHP
jgi:hypothetical protein